MDKYQAELEKAIKEATFIPATLYSWVIGFVFLGATQGPRGTTYYYRHPSTGEYYYESEFARTMRLKIRQDRLKKYTKK